MTVEQLLSSLNSAELTEWMAYLRLEAEQDDPDESEAWRKAFKAYG